MFEGKPPFPATEALRRAEQDGACAMRELTWSGLVAKLAAARDLRMILAADEDARRASFDSHSARRIAEQAGLGRDDGNNGVNLEASANGKWEAANGVPTKHNVATGVPRN